MQLVVGRIARAHGVGGEVAVEVHTDSPELRFAPGAQVQTDPPERGPLTVQRVRWHSGRLLVAFEEVPDRSAAEAIRGTTLVADSSTSPNTEDPDEYWDHQLIGLQAQTVDGTTLGRVDGVVHSAGGELLVVATGEGGEVLVPFVRAIVPEVDLGNGRVVVDPPEGLLDL